MIVAASAIAGAGGSIMTNRRRGLAVALLATLAIAGSAGAVDVPTKDVLVSRGVLGEIADPSGKRRLKGQYAYLFPGAKLVPVQPQPQGLGAGESLAHAENGLLVFVRLQSTLNAADLRKLRTAEIDAIGFVAENTGFKWVDGGAETIVGLGRREYFPVVAKDDFKVTIRVDVCAKLENRPQRCRDPGLARSVDVAVDRERIGVVELDQFTQPTMLFTGPMRTPVRSAIEGVTKHCREKVVQTFEAGGRFGLNVKAYFIDIGLDAGAETQRVLSFPDEVQVDFRYYSRDDGYLRRFVTEQPCEGPVREHRFLISKGPDATNSLDAIVEAPFWKSLGLETDSSTQKPVVRCAAQYWRLFTELVRMEVDERDAAFFMARMMTLRGFDDAGCLEATRAIEAPTADAAPAAPAG